MRTEWGVCVCVCKCADRPPTSRPESEQASGRAECFAQHFSAGSNKVSGRNRIILTDIKNVIRFSQQPFSSGTLTNALWSVRRTLEQGLGLMLSVPAMQKSFRIFMLM